MELFAVETYSKFASFGYANLFDALRTTAGRIYKLRSSKADWKSLIHKAFGSYTDINLKDINIILIPNNDIKGLRGAYHKGSKLQAESIFLNSEWVNGAGLEDLNEVLFEEVGHAIDQRINGSNDSYGDEGAIFSALIRNCNIPEKELSENDQRFIVVDGEVIEIEASTPSNPLVDNDDNGLVDGVDTINS